MTRRPFWIAVLAVVAMVLLVCAGFDLPAWFLIYVVGGWIMFLYRVVPQIRLDIGAMLLSSGALFLFGVGLHLLLSWAWTTAAADRRWRYRWTLSLASLTLLMFIAGISFVGITHQIAWLVTSQEPVFRSNSSAGSRMQSGNNLKQMALGVENYHDILAALPPGATVDAEGRLLHSWMTLILPFCEQRPLYDRINHKRPWDDPVQGDVFKTRIKYMESPYTELRESKDQKGRPLTHYAGNVHVLGGTAERTYASISDGRANTIIAGEAAGNYVPWGQPGNWRDPALGVNRSAQGFGGPWQSGTMFAFADGHVTRISSDVAPEVLRALATPAGGENVPDDY